MPEPTHQANRHSTSELHKLLVDAEASLLSAANESSFAATQGAIKDTTNLDIEGQTYKHRDRLLNLVAGLSIAGFLLLTIVTLLQMVIRIWRPGYQGISDVALNILAVSVFGEVIAVVATIVRLVWKLTGK